MFSDTRVNKDANQSQVSREAARLNLRWEEKAAVPWKREQCLILLPPTHPLLCFSAYPLP